MLNLLFFLPSKFVKLSDLRCLLCPSVFEINPQGRRRRICSQNWRSVTVSLIPALHLSHNLVLLVARDSVLGLLNAVLNNSPLKLTSVEHTFAVKDSPLPLLHPPGPLPDDTGLVDLAGGGGPMVPEHLHPKLWSLGPLPVVLNVVLEHEGVLLVPPVGGHMGFAPFPSPSGTFTRIERLHGPRLFGLYSSTTRFAEYFIADISFSTVLFSPACLAQKTVCISTNCSSCPGVRFYQELTNCRATSLYQLDGLS